MNDDPSSPDDEIGRLLAFELRKAAWETDNPGAWPAEKADFVARLREELGV